MAARKFADQCALLGHALAIACAMAGIGLLVAAPLHLVVYGATLLGVAIAIDVVVAVHCHDRRRSHPRKAHLRAKDRRRQSLRRVAG